MYHLNSNNIIHRDLAARNILISRFEIDGIKISDLGMSRLMEFIEGIQHTDTKIGPVKWMAPEALKNREYSSKTDVWSFGVVIFEVYSRQTPFNKMPLIEVGKGIIEGTLRLIPPDNCPLFIRELMQACLQYLPDKRPQFQLISKQLEQQILNL